MSHALFAAVLLTFPAALGAQAHPLVGNWDIELPGGMRMENGVVTPIMVKGTLAVVVQGDSLVGTLTAEPTEGRPARPPARLAAKNAPGQIKFSQSSEAKMNMNGEEMTRTMVSVYLFAVDGDALKGTVERHIEGLDDESMAAPMPITGKRVRG